MDYLWLYLLYSNYMSIILYNWFPFYLRLQEFSEHRPLQRNGEYGGSDLRHCNSFESRFSLMYCSSSYNFIFSTVLLANELWFNFEFVYWTPDCAFILYVLIEYEYAMNAVITIVAYCKKSIYVKKRKILIWTWLCLLVSLVFSELWTWKLNKYSPFDL